MFADAICTGSRREEGKLAGNRLDKATPRPRRHIALLIYSFCWADERKREKCCNEISDRDFSTPTDPTEFYQVDTDQGPDKARITIHNSAHIFAIDFVPIFLADSTARF